MSDVGRLPEAAEFLEDRAMNCDEAGLPDGAAEDRAMAALLRAIQTGNFAVTVHAATALAAAVLGLPEDNERTP